MKRKASPLSWIAQTLRSLNQVKQELADSLRLENEIKARKIAESSDLDHEFLRKLVKSAFKGAVIRLTMRSGDILEIFEQDYSQKRAEEGSATW